MIKIEINNIEDVLLNYYAAISEKIRSTLSFYLLVISVYEGESDTEAIIAYRKLHGRAKNAILTDFLSKTRITSSDYPNLSDQSIYKRSFRSRIDQIRPFLNQLNTPEILREIICGLPQELLDVENRLRANRSYLRPYINRLFNYNFLKGEDSSVGEYTDYHLAKELNVNVCPYCNRIYTNTVVKEKGLIRPSFDHFFSQESHPILSISFYNLIPSCTNCNSFLKHRKQFDLEHFIHPYLEGIESNEVAFSFLLTGFNKNIYHAENFKIFLKEQGALDLDAQKWRKIFGDGTPGKGSLKVFRLEEIYQKCHGDIVGEIYAKVDKNSPFYAMSLKETFKDKSITMEEFYRYYFGNFYDKKDFNKRPLSKLTKDIVTEFLPGLEAFFKNKI